MAWTKGDKGKQTLLVSDMVDAGDGTVEILDQDVRAEYVSKSCPATPAEKKCRALRVVPVGRGKEVDLSIRIFRAVPSGVVERTEGGPGDNGPVKLEDIRKRVQMFCRRYWAQAHVKFNIARLETVDLPSNMISVGDATGNLANGQKSGSADAGQVGFRISVDRFGKAANSVHNIAPFIVAAGKKPEETAEEIKKKIDAISDLSAEVSPNPRVVGNVRGSADVLITDAKGGRITLTNLTVVGDQDADQKVIIASLTLTVNKRNGYHDYHVGHPEQRNLVKQSDTGDKVIDIHVVEVVPGALGYTVPEEMMLIAGNRHVSQLKNSIIMPKDSSDSSTNEPFAFPHEIGHIMIDNSLHAKHSSRLMQGGYLGNSSAVTNPKRITSRVPSAANWKLDLQNPDGSVGSTDATFNTVARIGAESNDLMH